MKKLILAFLMSTFLLSSCGIDKKALTEEQHIFAGKWVADEENWIEIDKNGNGNMERGSISIKGGATTINDKEIEIGMFGINEKYVIDKKPYDENGNLKMKLDGIVYEKSF